MSEAMFYCYGRMPDNCKLITARCFEYIYSSGSNDSASSSKGSVVAS